MNRLICFRHCLEGGGGGGGLNVPMAIVFARHGANVHTRRFLRVLMNVSQDLVARIVDKKKLDVRIVFLHYWFNYLSIRQFSL